MSSSLYFQIHQTAEAFINSYDHNRCTADIHSLSSTLAPRCKRHIGPPSLHIQVPHLVSPKTNQQFEEIESHSLSNIESRSLEIKEIVVDEVQRKAVIHSMYRATMKPQHGGQAYEFEIILTLSMKEDGMEIVRISQFVDSLAATKFIEEQQWLFRDGEACGAG